jgi:hypothetical protein
MIRYSFIGIALLTFGLSSCVLNSKFTQSGDYQANTKISDLHLVVVGDKETKEAMDYLSQFLTDSLTKNNVKTTKIYHCCRDKDTDLNSLITKMVPTDYKPDYILTVVISKVIVGYGTTSSREIQLDLFNASFQKRTWTGKVTVNMSWFISDQDYRNVAGSLTKAIMRELKKKKIL